MQRKYWALTAGIAALLVVGIVALLRDGRESEESRSALGPTEVPTADPTLSPAAVADRKLEGVLAEIQALQIPSAIRKRLIVAYLATVIEGSPAPFAYWEPVALRDARARVEARHTADAVRQQVRAAFGDGVDDDPEFAFLFRPLADRYPALDSRKQLSLQLASLIPARALIESGLSPVQAQVRMKAAMREMDVQIARILSPEELREYQRKESSAARALASGGFRFTQKEFDAVLPGFAAKSGEVSERRFDPDSTESLRMTLGEKRFLEYSKSQDPTFHLLGSIVASHGKKDANVDVAYDAVYKSQKAFQEMLRAGPVLGFEAHKKKEQMTAELRRQLESSIGSTAAEIFLRSMDTSPGLVQTRLN